MLKPMDTRFTNVALRSPDHWDAETHGECARLPVHHEGDVYSSWWALTWRDRIKILFGGSIRLSIVAKGHPPVGLQVENLARKGYYGN